MTIRVSKNQRRMVLGCRVAVFVPYALNANGEVKHLANYCANCIARHPSRSRACSVPGARNEITLCGHYERKDKTYGYWKEVT